MLHEAASDAKSEYYLDAKYCLLFINKDTDGVYILDYLAKPLHPLTDFVDLATKAKAFLESENNKFRRCGDYKTASKYEKSLKYFETSGIVQ